MTERPLRRRVRDGRDRKRSTKYMIKAVCIGGPLDGAKLLMGFGALLFPLKLMLTKRPGKPRRCAVYKWRDYKLEGREVWTFVKYEDADERIIDAKQKG